LLACRACRIPLSAQTGCAVCQTARHNLVVVGETEQERPSLAGVGNEALEGLRDQITHFKDILATNPGNGQVTGKLVACTNALSKLTGELRKLQDDGKKTVDAMSFAERTELFVGWYMDLPPPYRLQLRERMAEHEVAVSAPIPADPTEKVLS
jgi:uncharacterized Zn finger protein (UPF0148 family)